MIMYKHSMVILQLKLTMLKYIEPSLNNTNIVYILKLQ